MTVSTKFADQGPIVSVISFDENSIRSELHPAVYSVGLDPMSGFFLAKEGDKLTEPTKVYGAVEKRVDRILTAYDDTDSSFGVLMSGAKGSGKTMCSTLVANRCIDNGIPVLLVKSSLPGSALANFIEKVGECVLFFDEFGKKFDNQEQDGLLGLFDGTGSSKRLIMVTENNFSDINRYMLDRPGRIHYHFRYGKLDEETVKEFCADHNVPDEVVKAICVRRERSNSFSFDVLNAIVSEWKLFGGEINDLARDLNIEQTYEAPEETLVILEAVTESGEQIHIKDKPYTFPGRGHTRLVIEGEKKDSVPQIDLDDEDDEDDEDDIEFEMAIGNIGCVLIERKDLVRKEADMYIFAGRRMNDDTRVFVKAIKDTVAANPYAY